MQKRIHTIILAALCLAAFTLTFITATCRTTAASLALAKLQQSDKLTANPRNFAAQFGENVAADGDTIVVGEDFNGQGGAAYVFKREGTGFALKQKLTANNTQGFGSAVALQGNTLLIGAAFENNYRGAAYVFTFTALGWVLQQRLAANDGVPGNYFGGAVALQNDTALIGALSDEIGTHEAQGSAYVFTRFNNAWTQKQKLTTSDGAAGDQLGASVAIHGNTCVLGAIGVKGAAYVFVLSHNVWVQQQKLFASDGAADDKFGGAVALHGEMALIGASEHGNDRGAVYVFTRTGTTWNQQQKLLASDGTASDFFGAALALDENGTNLVIGAPVGGASNQGCVYLFSLANGSWSQQQQLFASDGAKADYFGTGVGLSGTTLVSGADSEDGSGAAYVFQPLANAPPVLAPLPLTRMAGLQSAAPAAIANVSDLEDPESAVKVQVNNGTSATVNGVTLNGLSVTAAGAVMATITTACNAATASFTLKATDTGGATATATLTVTVTPNQPPVLTYTTPPAIPVGSSLTINPTSGPQGLTPINSIIVQSVTPPVSGSVTVNAQGVISLVNVGSAGPHQVTIRATNACGTFTDAKFSLNLACPGVTLNPAALPQGTMGQAYNASFSAVGGDPPHTFALYFSTLPNGLTLAPNGALTGTPTQAGVFDFTVQATSSNGCIGKVDYKMTINAAPCSFALTPASQSFAAAGGNGTVTVTMSSGANCQWTATSNANWLLITNGASGTGNGAVTFSAQANNTNSARTGTLTIAGKTFTVTQAGAQVCGALTINPASLPTLLVGSVFNQALIASGGAAPYSFAVTNGILPAGVTLGAQGALSGTPMIAGDTSFTVTTTDANGCKGSRTYNVTIHPRSFTSVSAASYLGDKLTSEMIVAGFGFDLAAQTVAAQTVPLPTQLAGTSVRVRDSQNVERLAPLFFVSPGQVNYLMPAGLAPGLAHVTLTNGANLLSEGDVMIAPVAPGIFTANATGAGFAAAQVVRVKPNGQQIYEEVVKFDPASQQLVAVPVDLTIAGDQVVLVLYGTGLRGRSNLNAVNLAIANTTLTAGYAGATGLAGLDQINALLPNSLANGGECNLTLTIDGKTANVVKLRFK